MCNFLSLLSDGHGKIYYFDYTIRKQIITGESRYAFADSHTSIADNFGLNEDKMNKWEYNPLTRKLQADQINLHVNDCDKVLSECKKLNFKLIVPELIIKPIIHPFRDIQNGAVLFEDIELLEQWVSCLRISVGLSVLDSVWDSIKDSVGFSVLNSVLDSVLNSVWYSVWYSVWDSVRDSVKDSVLDSVKDSVLDFVWAYTSSFFKLNKWKYISHKSGINPFQSCIDLWEKGLVPSFDGKLWRLHGVQGKILYEDVREG